MHLSLIVAGLLTAPTQADPGMAETPDTLRAVTVAADRGVVVSRTDTVQIFNSISVAEAFASVPGLYVADYGGAAGLKSVGLRGMGSPHTVIYVDGVRAGNPQSGQADLGMFDLGNCSDVVIDYAQNSISFNTSKPVFHDRPVGGKINFRAGSFGTCEPSGRLDLRLSDRMSLSATAGGVLSEGDFPLPDGSRRLNNDIRQVRTGLDFLGVIDEGSWHAKAYYNGSRRGTPGTLDWPSTDRQKDRNVLLQGLVRKRFTPLYTLHASAKASFDHIGYQSPWGDSFYRQTGLQFNTAHKFSICKRIDASFAADFSRDILDSDVFKASRTSVFATASAAFHPKRFKADIALEYAGIFDDGGQQRSILSPSAGLRWNVLKDFDLLAFARRAYRAPTFNELYYPGYGNPELGAEDAWLTDVGAEYKYATQGGWRFQLKADAFFNYLKDKIISAPTAINPDLWLPYNIGTVKMTGTDISASANYAGRILKGGASARYSFQNAIDKTTGSQSFGQQIPFISRHTVVLAAELSLRSWSAAISWNWRGQRYDSAGRMPDYNTLDLTAGKEIRLPEDIVLCLKFLARNLNDRRYELVSGYPMPGRAFLGEIDFKF